MDVIQEHIQMNLRKLGDALETRVYNLLKMKKTYNSGALLDDGDLKDQNFIVECKVKTTTQSINIPKALLEKVKAQADKWSRDWMIVNRVEGKDYVTLDLEVFSRLYIKDKNE